MIRITIAVPEAHIADANHLALCLGYGPADALTFGAADWQDAAGNRYAVCSTQAEPAFLTDAASPLAEPAWGADMAAAARAQALIVVIVPALIDPGPEPPDMTAKPARITAIVGDDPQQALAALAVVTAP